MHALVMYVWLLYWEMISSSLHVWSYSNCYAAILVFWHFKTYLNLFHNPWIAKVIGSFNEGDPYLNISEICIERLTGLTSNSVGTELCHIFHEGYIVITYDMLSPKQVLLIIYFNIINLPVTALPCYNKFLILKVFSTLGATFELCGREIWWLSIFLIKSCLR